MSKKSRKRNKRLLMLAALAGGAAFLGRGRGKGAVSTAGQPVGVKRTMPTPLVDADDMAISTKKKPIIKDVVTTKPEVLSTNRGITVGTGVKESPSGIKVPAIYRGSDALTRGVNAQIMQAKANAPKGIIRPGNYTPITHKVAFGHRGVGFKKGGSVTGIAKRGFGRALKKK